MIVSCETFQPRTGADSFGEREMAEQEDVNRYLQEVIAEAEALRIPLGSIKPEVRINSRAKKRLKKFWHMRFCIAAAAVRIMERNGKHTQTR